MVEYWKEAVDDYERQNGQVDLDFYSKLYSIVSTLNSEGLLS